ncbi:(1-_4)-alpha-D-glucan 1-alpha-D-glucosylmutase [Azospirillum fermentarium]|uniref:malto-oligosyltrehalose synthase n=1 Tax=Azospirillum fermentarium TaxID=1233114 RepID=UPI002226004A|nr:malto-oligosyltrehalose synthase [Azospirillum fermentarium]MCW2248735.1 (1->4)-alpha-D-glucan 1-alpha-D-glucosylmutase [Azospirillum fermentarium]
MTAPAVPRATYRLQFSAGFTFDQAAELAPYLEALGISHVYASPFLKARAGSSHGYDITDHAQLNPEIGNAAALDRMVAALQERGIGLILDFVPNHMGVGGNDNPWWLDVLEWGPASPFAPFFDIDWEARQGKVLLPFLGDHYGTVLERGELQARFDADRGAFSVWYHSHRLPIAVRHYARLLKQVRERAGEPGLALDALIAGFAGLGSGAKSVQRQASVHRQADELRRQLAATAAATPALADAIAATLAALNGTPGDPDSFTGLHRLLEDQHYRIAFWRVAADEINYRRFFDINDLAGLRIDRAEAFELAHQLVFRLIGEGKLQGIRLDHIDGLYDPAGYCQKLQDRAAYLTVQAPPSPHDAPGLRLPHPFYVVVEKILAHHESLRDGWAVSGTTGYEFMNLVCGLFVDPAAEEAMTAAYHTVIGRAVDLERLILDTKRRTMLTALSSELHVLAARLHRLAQQNWSTRDFTITGIQRALVDVAACLPVYRTYVTGDQVTDTDRKYLDWAVGRARRLAGAADSSLLDFIHAALTTDLTQRRGYRGEDVVLVAMTFQQFTGPVMAKALEDTVFYRYARLLCLNEVGGEPGRFGTSVSAFHHVNQERLARFPFGLLATATHDHKRGEDTRLRIAVLSEMPEGWHARIQRWVRLNRLKKRHDGGARAPSRNDEYIFYQTLVGAWPPGLSPGDAEGLAVLADRMAAYMLKAVREAKVRTSWANANPAYEEGVEQFVRAVLDPARSAAFLADVAGLVAEIGPAAAVNGLAQTLLKLTVPGVPDLYQGTEWWDFSLVDPDNRRPVDYAARAAALAADAPLETLLEQWADGRVKQRVIAAALTLRRAEPALFATGDYRPVEVTGEGAGHIVAFERRSRGGESEAAMVVVVPRLVLGRMDGTGQPLPPAESWGDAALMLPGPAGAWTDVITGAELSPAEGGSVPLSAVLARFPVALLHRRII